MASSSTHLPSAISEAPANSGALAAASPYARWLTATLVIIAFLTLFTAWLNWRIDILGLFHRDQVTQYALDRYSDYAMSYRFIPRNFNGLLLGNSLTTNWDTAKITGYRVFNCSIRGANFSEENLIARNVLAHSTPALAIVLVHPSFTSNHGRWTPYMTPDEYWSALGSVQTLTIYAQMALEKAAGPNTGVWMFQHRTFPYGGQNFRLSRLNAVLPEPASEFTLDPIAYREFADLIAEFHRRYVKLVFLLPPAYDGRWAINGVQVLSYDKKMLALAARTDRVIDLNDGSLRDVTSSRDNFPDYTHLTLPAADQAANSLAKRLASVR